MGLVNLPNIFIDRNFIDNKDKILKENRLIKCGWFQYKRPDCWCHGKLKGKKGDALKNVVSLEKAISIQDQWEREKADRKKAKDKLT